MKSIIYNSVQWVLLLALASGLYSCMPEAEFDVITIQAYTGVPVEFDNKSEKAKSYRWDFGDGSNSTKEKPVHTYARSGNYNVTLEAIRNNRSDFYSQPVVVELDLEKKMLSWGEDRIPGISLAILDNASSTISAYTAGLSHENTPIDQNMLFSMVMQTQLFTTVLCMKLVEQELMTLDEPIGNFLPTIEHVNPAITIRQLMQHTSGLDEIPQFGANVVGNPDKAWTYDDILSLLKAPVFEPGTDFHFSVINYILLAMITENIAGKTYVELIHEIITVPLKLKNTYLEGFDQIPANRPHPWWDNQDRGDESRVALGTAFRSLAAIVSTPSDMTKFYDAVFNNNFLSNESLSQITNFNVNTDYGPKGLGGLGIEYFNGQQYWFYETGGIGYSAMMIYSPTCRNVLCLSSNAFEETEFKKIMKFGWEMSDGLCGK